MHLPIAENVRASLPHTCKKNGAYENAENKNFSLSIFSIEILLIIVVELFVTALDIDGSNKLRQYVINRKNNLGHVWSRHWGRGLDMMNGLFYRICFL